VGKTILAWYIVENLLGNRATGSEKPLFYCTHERVASQKATVGEVLRSLVSQIFTRIWEDRPEIDEKFNLADAIMSDAHGIPDAIMEFFPGDNSRRRCCLTLASDFRFSSARMQNNRFGFFSPDRNCATDQGLLMIDKMSNHQRLVWEKVSMPSQYASPAAASS
jgi:hypothetical protein